MEIRGTIKGCTLETGYLKVHRRQVRASSCVYMPQQKLLLISVHNKCIYIYIYIKGKKGEESFDDILSKRCCLPCQLQKRCITMVLLLGGGGETILQVRKARQINNTAQIAAGRFA